MRLTNSIIDAVTGKTIEVIQESMIHPAKLFVTPEDRMQKAMVDIREELYERLKVLRAEDRLVELRDWNSVLCSTLK